VPRIRIKAFRESNGNFHIEGNRAGLEHLADVCLTLSRLDGDANHEVVGPGFNADDDSEMFYIYYKQSLE
jgi:hypothetical protein